MSKFIHKRVTRIKMANDEKCVRTALARCVAEYKISDEVIDLAAKQLATAKHPIRGIDVCTYGICLDYFLDGEEWWKTLPELIAIEGGQVKGVEIFPWGILNPDLLHVRVTQSMDAIPQVRGFEVGNG
jgi:hypothetical protein